MGRVYQQYCVTFLFLVLLLHCTQMCFAAGHTRTTSASPPDSAQTAPCHTSDRESHSTPEKCPDCGEHFFLKPLVLGGEELSASSSASRFLAFPVASVSVSSRPVSLDLRLSAGRAQRSVPLYLSFSIFRL